MAGERRDEFLRAIEKLEAGWLSPPPKTGPVSGRGEDDLNKMQTSTTRLVRRSTEGPEPMAFLVVEGGGSLPAIAHPSNTRDRKGASRPAVRVFCF